MYVTGRSTGDCHYVPSEPISRYHDWPLNARGPCPHINMAVSGWGGPQLPGEAVLGLPAPLSLPACQLQCCRVRPLIAITTAGGNLRPTQCICFSLTPASPLMSPHDSLSMICYCNSLSLFWGLMSLLWILPLGKPPGHYSGTLTVTVHKSQKE